MIYKGQKIYGPDGQGYEIAQDIREGDYIDTAILKPFGGAPEPHHGVVLGGRLLDYINARLAYPTSSSKTVSG